MAFYNPNLPPSTSNPTSSFLSIPQDIPSNPFLLTAQDILTVLLLFPLLPGIVLPLHPLSSPLDELYPTLRNLRDLYLQTILLLIQISLLFSLPFAFITLWAVPCIVYASFYISFGVNTLAQSNLTLLANIFSREIIGIQNSTKGLLLDIAECLIQRDLNYTTHATRVGRAQLYSALSSEHTKKVVLIAHSQGGIIASAIIDWLIAELGDEELGKLEVYTFGSAGRVLRNPLRRRNEGGDEREKRTLGYVEHYANTGDLVSRLGVLQFMSGSSSPSRLNTNYIHNQHSHRDTPFSRFHGPAFIREGSGHLLNMHYLDTMFNEDSGFMNKLVDLSMGGGIVQRPLWDLSRLWKYRSGGSPDDGKDRGGGGGKDGVNVKSIEG
ncbi:hypothetical protein BDW71DRAFT_202602 [Aspergillus fruticulosus]